LKELANKHQGLIIFAALGSVFVLLQMRVQSILPSIMGDELFYSMQSRKLELSELSIPNYLYSWLYSSTNMCGINFYSCAKNLNLVFFAGFVALIFWLATQFMNRWWAGALAVATALSPLSAYTAVFMPESMYFFLALLAVVALWLASKSQVWWHLTLAAVVLGLASLVKPHALFLAAGASIYLLLIHWGSLKQQGLAIANYLGTTLATKLVLGFVFAGANGLTLFGPTYSGAAGDFIGTLFGQDQNSSTSTDSGGDSEVATALEGGGLTELLGYALGQLGWLTVVVGLVGAGLVAASLSGFKLLSRSAAEEPLRRLAQLLLISLGTMVIVVAAFAAQVTYGGDDHTQRLLFRYFEFLIAPISVVATATLLRQTTTNLRARILALVAGATALAFLGYSSIIDSQQMFADSTFLYGLTANEFSKLFGLFFVLATLAALLSAWQLRTGAFVLAIALGFGGLGTLSIDRLYSQAAFPGFIDSAGIFARDYLADVPSEQIYFLGTNKQLTEASIFWLDKPNVGRQFFIPGSLVDEQLIPEGVRWLVVLDGVGYDGERLFEVVGNQFSVARVGPINEHRFDRQMTTSPLSAVSGLSEPTALGSWNTGPEMSIEFGSDLQANARFVVSLLVSDAMVGQPLLFKLGESELEVVLDQPGTSIDLRLEFANQQPETTLEIRAIGEKTMLVSRVEITN